jgi:hypothetical protein
MIQFWQNFDFVESKRSKSKPKLKFWFRHWHQNRHFGKSKHQNFDEIMTKFVGISISSKVKKWLSWKPYQQFINDTIFLLFICPVQHVVKHLFCMILILILQWCINYLYVRCTFHYSLFCSLVHFTSQKTYIKHSHWKKVELSSKQNNS